MDQAVQRRRPLENLDSSTQSYSHSVSFKIALMSDLSIIKKRDVVTIFASTEGNLSFTNVLSECLSENLQLYKRKSSYLFSKKDFPPLKYMILLRESLNTIFNHSTERMSQQEGWDERDRNIVCLLPEMVSSLRKDLYFFKPEVNCFIKI